MVADPEPAPVWRLDVSIPGPAVPVFEAALAELGGAIVTDAPEAQAEVRLQAYLDAEPQRPRLTALLAGAALRAGVPVPAAAIERLPDVDWVTESHQALPAIQAGPFYIHGAHVEEPAPDGAIPILIEAGPAFGTNHRRPLRALDMGCGSGLLAIAIAKLWGCPVGAVDNDRSAVRAAAGNAAANGVGELVTARLGEGYRDEALTGSALGPEARFDLIVANILAAPLQAMAPDLKRHLAPGGVAVLSGLLEDQAAAVIAAHAPLRLARHIRLGGWATLVLEA
jgi:ribosomal protein L11 methyltransferase